MVESWPKFLTTYPPNPFEEGASAVLCPYSTASEATGRHTQPSDRENRNGKLVVASGRFARGTVMVRGGKIPTFCVTK